MSAVTTTTTLRPGRWQVDARHTSATFEVSHLGFGTVRGTIPVTAGHVLVDAAGRPTAAEAALDATAIATGHPKRDDDLRRKSPLLSTGRWPAITFRARELTPDGDGWAVRGDLHVRDRTVPVRLAAQLVAVDGDGHRVRATTSIDRRDAGITAPAFLIGRQVAITVEAVLRPSPGASV